MLFDRPLLVMDRATIAVTPPGNAQALNAIELATVLQEGGAAIAIDDAKFTLDQTGAGDAAKAPSESFKPVLLALSRMSVKSLTVRDAKIMTKRRDSDLATLIGRLTCDIVKSNDEIAAKGTFERHGMHVPFEITLATNAGDRLPLTATTSSEVVSAKLTGEFVRSRRFSIVANSVDVTARGKDLLRLLSGESVGGHGFEDFRASGALDWTDQVLALQTATITLDGNEATGGLSINVAGKRPQLEGTLAFANLELAPYVRPLPLTLGLTDNVLNWSRWLIGDPSAGSMVRDVDADIRISAAGVTSNGRILGQGAATLSVTDGKLLADLAEFQLENDAQGEARISLDLSGDKPLYEVRGSLETQDLAQLTNAFSGRKLLSGAGNLNVQLSASGDTQEEFRNTLAGSGTLSMPDGGKVGFDLWSLMAAAKAGTSGWGQAADGSTNVESLEAKFQASQGTVTATDIEAQSANRLLQAAGTVNIASQTIDVLIAASAEGAAPAETPAPGDKVRISGSLVAPTIKLEGVSKSSLPAPSRSLAKLP